MTKTKCWKKTDDDYVMRVYQSKNRDKIRVLKKSLTVQLLRESKPSKDLSRAYSLKSATSFANSYMRKNDKC